MSADIVVAMGMTQRSSWCNEKRYAGLSVPVCVFYLPSETPVNSGIISRSRLAQSWMKSVIFFFKLVFLLTFSKRHTKVQKKTKEVTY
ncbi:hypothetical protein XELAEV_18003851mg [Xenopus laevis]|nr:hypothetical protein XELAEV_18003851mg [Xenopus laevis]